MKNFKVYEMAIRLASEAHEGQLDKAGMPYILHPLRVAESLHTFTGPFRSDSETRHFISPVTEEEMVVAVLHDIVEDTPVTAVEIRTIFGDIIGDGVDAMTKLEKVGGMFESYREYLDRVRSNSIAFRVKIVDMADNSRPDRLASLSIEKQLRLVAKYTRGRHYLLTGEWFESEDLDRIIKAGAKK